MCKPFLLEILKWMSKLGCNGNVNVDVPVTIRLIVWTILKFIQVGQTFSSPNAEPTKNAKKLLWLVLPNEICLIPLSQVHSSINYLNLCCMNEDSSELTLKTYPGDIAPLMKLLKSLFWIYNSRIIIIIIIIMIIIIVKFLWSAAIHTCNLSALWKCKKQNIRNIQTKLLVT